MNTEGVEETIITPMAKLEPAEIAEGQVCVKWLRETKQVVMCRRSGERKNGSTDIVENVVVYRVTWLMREFINIIVLVGPNVMEDTGKGLLA